MVPRVILGEVVRWPVFGPVAFAGIGTLPAPILSRSIVMHIQRKLPNVKFDVLDIHNKNQMDELAGIKNEMMKWALSVNLNTAPEMPTGFEGRRADKWRVLFAIADSLGRGSIARKAAIKFGIEAVHVNELLLIDIRKVFDKLETKRIPSYVLVEELIGLEDPEYDWSEFKGTRPLTVGLCLLSCGPFKYIRNQFGGQKTCIAHSSVLSKAMLGKILKWRGNDTTHRPHFRPAQRHNGTNFWI
jgi:hypothetical protein